MHIILTDNYVFNKYRTPSQNFPKKKAYVGLFITLITFSFSTDNHAAHHEAGVEDIIQATGALVEYLPPYCPELNPIKEIFSIVKAWLRGNELMHLITPEPEDMILRGFFNVSRSDVQSLYTHCGC